MMIEKDWALLAKDIAESDAVLGVYAAPEWAELSDDGRAWLRAIVEESWRRFDVQRGPTQ